MKHPVSCIQSALRAQKLAGWLLYDFRGSNPVALALLAPETRPLLTRRFFYWIPAGGEPVRIQSAVESQLFADLPGRQLVFRSWRELADLLRTQLPATEPIAMEYSPGAALPGVSFVDGGTLEWLRQLGLNPVSSAELIQAVEAPWDEAALALHREASTHLETLRREAIATLGEALATGRPIRDTEVQIRLLDGMAAAGLVTKYPPIVAFGPDSGDPHFSPNPARPRTLEPGQVVLLDYWAKVDAPNAVYADYTWMAYAGASLPERESRVWEVVRGARDAVIAWLAERFAAGEEVRGCDVDPVAREHIARCGFGDRFLHRLGHNIGVEEHGPGVNLDDLETHDERRLIEGVAFSIEPGIYLKDFGMRSELNALRWRGELLLSGELQESPDLLL